jgi:hypothetical protein
VRQNGQRTYKYLALRRDVLLHICTESNTAFVTGLARWVPLVEQELLTLPEHPSSTPVLSGVRVTRSSAR